MIEAREPAVEPGKSFVLERIYDAPRVRVYMAWTHPALLEMWWGIEGSTSVIKEMHVRPGGAWSIEMRTPSGKSYPNSGVFKNVIENELLEYTQLVPGGDQPDDPEFVEIWHRVSFTDETNGRTKVKVVVTAPARAVRDRLLGTGIAVGMSQGLSRLAQLLSTDTN